MFISRVQNTPNAEAFSYPDASEQWQKTTWTQVGERVRKIASGLRALGLEDEARVAIVSGTRVEWLYADLGIMCAGGACTTIYPNSTPSEVQYILEDSGSVLCFAADDGQVAKLLSQKDQLPELKHIITFDGKASGDGFVMTLADLEAKGAEYDKATPDQYKAVIDRITPDRLATLIYTSGTTGKPKGVELLHDCWLYTGEALEEMNILGPSDKQYLWLPLSHSFGKVLETIAVHLGVPTAVDGRIPKIIENLAVVQPTFMAAAPRIFEKVYNKVIAGAKEAGGLKFKIFKWSMGIGKEVSKIKQAGKEPTGLLAMKYGLATKLVFSKLQARFGGRIRFFISGSAPLNRDIAEFFHAAGLLILEGYGLTESSAASFVNPPTANKFGTVGPILAGGEVRIDDETGEIQFKSRGVMRGYYNLPEVTAETLKDGWLCTGDKGELDADGYLRITDRIKNLIKTSGGKYVAPAAIEGAFKAICPLVSQILVHGNRRNFCSALITMDEESIVAWAKDNDLGDLSYADLSKHEKVIGEFQKAFDQLNGTLARFETIKKFHILPKDWTVEDGELTASLKVKRKVVEQKHMDILDGFYTDAFAQM
ncbi:MAG: long-chain fatty acid--CoA ligase [Myxococcales bacterium]|nr:long-chain fatty acid--CoA ligase [Myxococcales bacterium]MCB9523643.1 long-chain fatty acid--CoA ligase [Myxococcales bacterium]